MEPNTYQLVPGGYHEDRGWVGITWHLVGPTEEERFSLQHSLPATHRNMLPSPERADHALVSVLLYAMSRKATLRVRGEVSPALLDGLDTLQSIWHRWRPQRYQPIDILVDIERPVEAVADERQAVFAFSGGVDATFTLFRHLKGAAGRTSRQPGAAMLVHGMDIPLEQMDFFEGAATRAERILKPIGVPLLPMRTNTRQLGQNWEDSYGLQLAGCFICVQRHFRWGIRGSEKPYNSLIMPWGSTPLTDYLASTEVMSLIHDGAQFDRTEKVDWLATNTTVTDDLRVCWAGSQLDRNCGVCEKCVRTMLNFWATGHKVPSAFSSKLTPELVHTIRPQNDFQLAELRSLLVHAQQHHAESDSILVAVKSTIRRVALASYRRKAGNIVRRIFRL